MGFREGNDSAGGLLRLVMGKIPGSQITKILSILYSTGPWSHIFVLTVERIAPDMLGKCCVDDTDRSPLNPVHFPSEGDTMYNSSNIDKNDENGERAGRFQSSSTFNSLPK